MLCCSLPHIARARCILLPLALGEYGFRGHIDHRIACDAALRCADPARLAFYEDLPYAARRSSADLDSARAGFLHHHPNLQPLLLSAPSAGPRKAALAALYPSQIDAATAGQIAAFSAHRRGEQLYAAPQAHALLSSLTPPAAPVAPPAPAVSVLMTVFNAAPFLAEAVESVLAQQTSATWELLIVDDGSTDASPHIAQNFADRDFRIRVLAHPHRANLGISASRNLAIEHARGNHFALLDADDVWLPYRLEHQLQALALHPEAGMVYGQAERWLDVAQPFDEHNLNNGANYIPPLIPHGAAFGVLSGPTLLDWFLADESFTPCTCSVLVQAALTRRLGGFEAPFRGLYDDQVFYAKVALAAPILVDPRCVARYRRHPDSCCWQAENTALATEARAGFLAWLEHYRSTHHPNPALAATTP